MLFEVAGETEISGYDFGCLSLWMVIKDSQPAGRTDQHVNHLTLTLIPTCDFISEFSVCMCVWTWLYAFEGDDKATKSQEAKQKYEKPLLHVNQNHTQKGVFCSICAL